MSCQKMLVIAFVMVAAAALVACRPSEIQQKFLSDVVNKTMCPIKVDIDENIDRVPRRIKFIRCDKRPSRLCEEHQMHHGCCKRHHHNYMTECVEIYDWVQVTYKGSDAPATIKVPVGCTCMIQESTTVVEILP